MTLVYEGLVHVVKYYDSPEMDGGTVCGHGFCVRRLAHLARSYERVMDPSEEPPTCLWCVTKELFNT